MNFKTFFNFGFNALTNNIDIIAYISANIASSITCCHINNVDNTIKIKYVTIKNLNFSFKLFAFKT